MTHPADDHPAGLQALADGDLPPAEVARLREHLRSCAACRRELEAIEAVRAALLADAGEVPLRPMWPAVRRQFRRSAPVRFGWSLALQAATVVAAGFALGVALGPGTSTTGHVGSKAVWAGIATPLSGGSSGRLADGYLNLADEPTSETP